MEREMEAVWEELRGPGGGPLDATPEPEDGHRQPEPEIESEDPELPGEAASGSRPGPPGRRLPERDPNTGIPEPRRPHRRAAHPGPAPPAPAPPAHAEPRQRVRVEIRALRPEPLARAEATVREAAGADAGGPSPAGDVVERVVLYAVHSPPDLVALLRPSFEPKLDPPAHPERIVVLDLMLHAAPLDALPPPSEKRRLDEDPGIVLDLEDALDPKVAALLGLHGYLGSSCPASQIRHGLELVAQGYAYATGTRETAFYHAREGDLLTIEMKRILDRLARGRTHAQIVEELNLSASTLRRRLESIRKLLGLEKRANLLLAAVECGFGPAQQGGKRPSQ